MFWKRITVGAYERVIVTKNGRFGGILTPGCYAIFVDDGVEVDFEIFDVRDLVLQSRWSEFLIREKPELINRYFTQIAAANHQIALVYSDGLLREVLPPGKRVLFWLGQERITAEFVDVIGPALTSGDRLASCGCAPIGGRPDRG